MYVQSQFEEKRTEVMHQLIDSHSFGTLVTLGADGINANHMPFMLDHNAGEFGMLRAHVARNNPVWRDFSRDIETLAIFEGASAYVSPSWYPSKQEHGKVVPTYNYMVVHAYGTMRVIDDPAWMKAFLHRLTDSHEANRPVPWKVDDAPQDFIDKLVDTLIGIEIPIARLLGKWKVSQNRSDADRAGVAAGLRAKGGEDASVIADAVVSSRT
jgi:transcriptional regulator